MEISLSANHLQFAFPFHLAFDRHMKIVQMGRHIVKIFPLVCLGELLCDHFTLKRPYCELEFTKILERLHTPYLLKSLHRNCELKGEMIYIAEQDVILFLGTPNVTDLASLHSLGISLQDFPIHSSINDFLFLLQTQKIALEDARKLTHKLSLQNDELVKREKALEQAHQEKEILHDKNLKYEMEIAFNIQQSLLFGKIPQDIPGLDIQVMAIPSQNISGDFYDFFSHNTKCLDVVIGDVMGKGVPAALVAAAIKSRLLRFANQGGLHIDDYELLPPKDIIQQLHQEVSPELIQLETFATMCYTRFDLHNLKMDILDCGHTSLLHFHSGQQTVEKIAGDNVPFAVLPNAEFAQKQITFQYEDIFLMYSDGIIEAKNKNDELFAEQNLMHFLKENHDLSMKDMLSKLKEVVMQFSHNNIQDDLTCIAIQVKNIGGHTKFHNVQIIKSRLSEIARARNYITNACQNLPYFQKNEFALQEVLLVTNEILSNIIKHSYKGNPNYIIRIEVLTASNFIKIYFVDKGVPFPFPEQNEIVNLRDLPADELKKMEGGFGIFIIHELVDELTYYRDDKGYNYLCIIKHLA